MANIDSEPVNENIDGVAKTTPIKTNVFKPDLCEIALEEANAALQRREDAAQVQEIRESLGVAEIYPVVNEQHIVFSLQEIMLDDLRKGGRGRGPYTDMREQLIKTYGYNYEELETLVQDSLGRGQEPAQVEFLAREQLHSLINKVLVDRRADLEQWSKLLRETTHQNRDTIRSVRSNLESFYGTQFQSKSFQVFLVPNPQIDSVLAIPSDTQLGALTTYAPRIREKSGADKKRAAEDLIVDSFHEMSHQQLQAESFSRLEEEVKKTDLYSQVLDIYCDGQEPYYNFTKEAVTNYIDVYIRQSFFYREPGEKSEHVRDVYLMESWIDASLASEYFSQNKTIDREFVERLFQLMLS